MLGNVFILGDSYSTYEFVCKKNNVEVIELHNIEKVHGHPTIKGMMEIKDQILEYIKSK